MLLYNPTKSHAGDAASPYIPVLSLFPLSGAAFLCSFRLKVSYIGVAAFLRLLVWLAELILLPSQQIWDGPGTSWDWLRIFGAQGCHAGMVSSILFWLGTASAVLALCWMTGQPILYLYSLRCIFTMLSTFTILSISNILSTFSILFTCTILSILRSGQFHVCAHQMHVHLLLAHASCLYSFKL